MNRTREILSKKRSTPATKEEVFKSVCMDVSENLDADLTSIWFFDKDQTQIECQCCFDAITKEFTKGGALKNADYPTYFNSIVEFNFISAPEALTNSATKELAESYFKPKGIVSLIDFILHRNFNPIGVICCENRSSIRNWSESDKDYLRSISALVSFQFQFTTQ